MPDQSAARIRSVDLDKLMDVLEVRLISMSEVLVEPDSTTGLQANEEPAFLYCRAGGGRIFIGDAAPLCFCAHTLIIAPAHCHIKIEAAAEVEVDVPPGGEQRCEPQQSAKATTVLELVNTTLKAPKVAMLHGHFSAKYGSTIDLFGALETPIVEQFSVGDRLEVSLRTALQEFSSQEPGSHVMTATLLMQVILLVMRRSLDSSDRWVERFSVLRDLRIAHALTEMVSRPGAPHSVESLSRAACLSRSAFMLRFNSLVGTSPMAILRDLRMRQAARQLETHSNTVDQVSHSAGYESVSSFLRAFRHTYGIDPSQYRASSKTAHRSWEPPRVTHALAA